MTVPILILISSTAAKNTSHVLMYLISILMMTSWWVFPWNFMIDQPMMILWYGGSKNHYKDDKRNISNNNYCSWFWFVSKGSHNARGNCRFCNKESFWGDPHFETSMCIPTKIRYLWRLVVGKLFSFKTSENVSNISNFFFASLGKCFKHTSNLTSLNGGWQI